jgi:choline kinase
MAQPIDTAVVLVAGEGKRLRPFTDTQPKCFVPVNGRKTLQNALSGLAAHGCKTVRIVVGHLADVVRSEITDRHCGMSIQFVENPDYRTTNSMYSLALGLDGLDAATWVLEGDIFFQHSLLTLSNPGDVEWFVDSSLRTIDGAYVEADGQGKARSLEIMRDISKIRPTQNKSVGVLRLSRPGTQLLRDWLRSGIQDNRQNDYYDLIVRDHLHEANVRVVDVAGHRWAEIDSALDLEQAERSFAMHGVA